MPFSLAKGLWPCRQQPFLSALTEFPNAEVLPIECPGWIASNFEQRWAELDARQQLLHLVRQVESERSLLGMSPHLIAIGTKE